jgi:type IV pilus assembly protein PilE
MHALRSKVAGFTLIELMITLMVIAIISAIAYPSYRSYVLRTQRTDAMTALLQLAAAQEKFYLQNNTYATNSLLDDAPPTGLGIGGTEHGWYTLAIDAASDDCPLDTCWAARATPVATGPQKDDADCTLFTLDSTGVKGAKKGDADNTEKCWR